MRLETSLILFYYIPYYIFYHVPFILMNISDDGETESRGRPLHAKNLMPLQTDNLHTFSAYDRDGENFFFKGANPNGGKNVRGGEILSRVEA
jgi:hypothetical protein